MQPFIPTLTTTNWNDEWKRLQETRRSPDDAAFWDERAKTFPVKHGVQTEYVDCFLNLAAIGEDETVFDMGCGTGALATPLALRGCRVIACDFSSGMLDKMHADQAELGVTNVESHLLSWNDNWEVAGLGPECADVAIASRSIVTEDLEESLLKLDRCARRRVCITLPCGSSPKIDDQLLEAAGFSRRFGQDYLYAFNILASQGIHPEVNYIESSRAEYFETKEEAVRTFNEIVMHAAQGFASGEEIGDIPNRLEPWLDENLIHDEKGFHLRKTRRVTWAFIAWNK